MDREETLATKYRRLFRHLDERQRRLVVAADAQLLGRGGVSLVSRTSGLSRPTIYQGLRELDEEPLPSGRVRRPGGGRKTVEEVQPGILEELEHLIDPSTRGDPMSPLRWTSKSTRHLAEAMAEKGYSVSHQTMAELLRVLGYSLQGTAKTLEGKQHPDRDAQFRYINDTTKRFLGKGWPVISVDTKKKELVGQFKQGGKEWQPEGEPEAVNTHDFPTLAEGKAFPYGVYDMGQDLRWVNVGTDHDTSSFAVESIRRWWSHMGSPLYPEAPELLLCADAGGSNGHRRRMWKFELHRFATETGIIVTACHFPPGTSKWNKIEHRLFSHISMNWRGRPLITHAIIVDLIGSTQTKSGLRVEAQLDTEIYPTGLKVSKQQMEAINLSRHEFHGDWNYTIRPAAS